jgi:uncharacterized protein YqgV (UPF0045/DUF77 family)
MQVRAELGVYPFRGGETLPPPVEAEIAELRKAGLDVQIQPLGTVVTGEPDILLEALPRALKAALDAGGTKIALSLEVVG